MTSGIRSRQATGVLVCHGEPVHLGDGLQNIVVELLPDSCLLGDRLLSLLHSLHKAPEAERIWEEK